MQADEIVVGEMQVYGGLQVLNPLGDGERQPRKPLHARAYGEILPLDVVCADMGLIGLPTVTVRSVPVMRGGCCLQAALPDRL